MGLLVSLGVPHHKLEAMYVLFRVEPIIRYRGYGASQVFTTYWAFWYTHYNSLFIVDTLKILTWKQVGEERIKYLVLWNSHCKVSLNHSLYPNFWKWSCYFFITQAYYNTDCIKKMAESWWGGGCLHADRRLQRFVAHFLSAAEYSTPTNKHPLGGNSTPHRPVFRRLDCSFTAHPTYVSLVSTQPSPLCLDLSSWLHKSGDLCH
jgi:hypothetical protein